MVELSFVGELYISDSVVYICGDPRRSRAWNIHAATTGPSMDTEQSRVASSHSAKEIPRQGLQVPLVSGVLYIVFRVSSH